MEIDTDTTLDAALEQPIVYQVDNKIKGKTMRLPVIIVVFVLLIGAGIGTGYGASKLIGPMGPAATPATGAPGTITEDQIEVGQTYGSTNTERYKDSSEGIIAEGGIEGEGTHHLIRPGGASQTVYLTSSVVDLDPFIGDKVQLMGETFSAQKASWFMDVGSVKVIELNAAAPEGMDQEKEVPTE